eukprot:COSAG01_NODE_19021_length_1036_cov_0.717182_2_plen_78_part_00
MTGYVDCSAVALAPAVAPSHDLLGFLQAHRCEAYHAALLGLGAQMPQDLKDMEDADWDSVGMTMLEKERLLKALATI